MHETSYDVLSSISQNNKSDLIRFYSGNLYSNRIHCVTHAQHFTIRVRIKRNISKSFRNLFPFYTNHHLIKPDDRQEPNEI